LAVLIRLRILLKHNEALGPVGKQRGLLDLILQLPSLPVRLEFADSFAVNVASLRIVVAFVVEVALKVASNNKHTLSLSELTSKSEALPLLITIFVFGAAWEQSEGFR